MLIRVWMRPACHTLSNAFSTSMNMAAEKFFIFLACMTVWMSSKILSCIDLFFRKPACSSFILLLVSAQFVSLFYC